MPFVSLNNHFCWGKSKNERLSSNSMAFVWRVCAHLQLHWWLYVSYSWACSSECGVAWILWFSINIYSLNPFPFPNECFTKSQSLKLVAIKKEKSNENVAMFPPLPPFRDTTYRGQTVLSWRQHLLGCERQVSREKCLREGTSQVKTKVVREKLKQAVFLTQWRLNWKVYLV